MPSKFDAMTQDLYSSLLGPQGMNAVFFVDAIDSLGI